MFYIIYIFRTLEKFCKNETFKYIMFYIIIKIRTFEKEGKARIKKW